MTTIPTAGDTAAKTEQDQDARRTAAMFALHPDRTLSTNDILAQIREHCPSALRAPASDDLTDVLVALTQLARRRLAVIAADNSWTLTTAGRERCSAAQQHLQDTA